MQNLRTKSKVLLHLRKYATYKYNKNLRQDDIAYSLLMFKKRAIFVGWRNIINSIKKSSIKLHFEQAYTEKYEKMNIKFSNEMNQLKETLLKLEADIQKEIDERKSLSELYDISLKKGAVQFLQETNYIVGFNTSGVETPNEQSINLNVDNQ